MYIYICIYICIYIYIYIYLSLGVSLSYLFLTVSKFFCWEFRKTFVVLLPIKSVFAPAFV